MEHLLSRFVPYPLLRLLPRPSAPSASAMETRLATLLGVWPSALPSLRLGPKYHYRPFTVAKRDGRERRILAPSPALKKLQRNLLHNYLDKLLVHPAATAFRRNCSIVDNARRHAGQKLIATLDLVDFFESTTASRVRGFFLKQGWRGEALSTLMRLCVYRNGLPQGAPTSPALSNLVNFEMDGKIASLASRAGAIYTRYGDDLTLSWSTDHVPGYFVPSLVGILTDTGYTIQPRKPWRVQRAGDEPTVTGLVLGRSGQLKAPWPMRWAVFKLRWYLRWHPGDAHVKARLQGYQAFMQSIEVKEKSANSDPVILAPARWSREILRLRWRLFWHPRDHEARGQMRAYQTLLSLYGTGREDSRYEDFDDDDEYDEDFEDDDLDDVPF